MLTFLLVHGANWSGWTWHKVVSPLREAGHDVYAPTLTGVGERAHLISPQVGLGTHVDDIVGLLEFEDLRGVVLVGSSYGGMVVTAVADRVPERLAHVVYLDATVPRDGESALDLMEPAARAAREEMVRTKGAGWFVPPSGPEGFADYVARGECSEEDIVALVAKSRPQPFKTWREAVRLENVAPAAVPRTFVYCPLGKPPGGTTASRRALEAGWRFEELDASHIAPWTAPRLVAEALLALA